MMTRRSLSSGSILALPLWLAAVEAGLVSGVVYAIWIILGSWIFLEQSPATPIHRIAALVLGQQALAPSGGLVFLAGLTVLLLLSILFAVVLALFITRKDDGVSL